MMASLNWAKALPKHIELNFANGIFRLTHQLEADTLHVEFSDPDDWKVAIQTLLGAVDYKRFGYKVISIYRAQAVAVSSGVALGSEYEEVLEAQTSGRELIAKLEAA